MKITKYIAAFFIAATLTACSTEEEEMLSGEGNLSIEFDNAFGDSDLILNSTSYNSNLSEKINISSVKYIVSNFKLETEEGAVFTYPKEKPSFIHELTSKQEAGTWLKKANKGYTIDI